MNYEGKFMNYDLHIRVPIFHPKDRYGWKEDEIGIGIAIKIMNKPAQFLKVKVGKDEKSIYIIDKNKVVEFTNQFKNSFDNCKGIKLVVIPIGNWGKKLGIYKIYEIKNRLSN